MPSVSAAASGIWSISAKCTSRGSNRTTSDSAKPVIMAGVLVTQPQARTPSMFRWGDDVFRTLQQALDLRQLAHSRPDVVVLDES